jgi:hypothetical protein
MIAHSLRILGGHYASRTGAEDSDGFVGIALCGWRLSLGDFFQASGQVGWDEMMLSIYVTLGVFLLLAVRNPSANRSLIAFTAWSSFAHGAVMAFMALKIPSERTGLLIAVAVLYAIGVALIALMPAKRFTEQASAVGAWGRS